MVMLSPPLLTSGSDPAAPAAQLRNDPASLGGGATAAAAAAAGIASDAATALPSPGSPASPGARRSSQEIELARRYPRRSSPPLPATDTAALHARWLRRRMEMEEVEATVRVAAAVAAAEAAATNSRYREAIAERHAARRGVAWGTKLPLPSPSPHRAESFDWASLEWLEAPAPLVRRLPQLYGATGQKYGATGQTYGATGQTLRGSASAPKLQQQTARATWRTPDGRSRQSRGGLT